MWCSDMPNGIAGVTMARLAAQHLARSALRDLVGQAPVDLGRQVLAMLFGGAPAG
jgi:hypothetical protein